MRVPFQLLDVFAEAPFAGNQLCVVSETPDGLDGETMQTLAHEDRILLSPRFVAG